ncbi:T-cell receptor beta chain V region E1 [Lemmus lemmus]
MASVTTDSTGTLLEQKPRWGLVRRGQAVTLRCILKNSQYPWMSWYQQDLQQQLQWLVSLRSSGDKEVKSLPGADYLATRITDTELRLQVANMTQGRTLFCTCSTDTVVSSAEALEQKPHTQSALPSNPCFSASPSEFSSFLPRFPYPFALARSGLSLIYHLFFFCLSHTGT